MLLRHAKSSWDSDAAQDRDRPLAGRGRRAAPLVAMELVRRGWLPDAVLVSTAKRTRETWALLAPAFGNGPTVDYVEALYDADWRQILGEIRSRGAARQRLMVVGHNPGLEALAGTLAGAASDRDAMERMVSKFPTGAVARLCFEGEWAQLARGGARLGDFLTPRDIGTS